LGAGSLLFVASVIAGLGSGASRGSLTAGRLGLEGRGERLERLRIAGRGDPGRVELRRCLVTGRHHARPELVGGVDHDLPGQVAGLLDYLRDRVPGNGAPGFPASVYPPPRPLWLGREPGEVPELPAGFLAGSRARGDLAVD